MSTLVRFLVEYPVTIGTLFAALFVAARVLTVPEDRKRSELFFAVSCLAMPAAMACNLVVIWLSKFAPFKLDPYIFRIDGVFGFQPSFLMGQFVDRHLWLEIIANTAYNALPCAILAVFAAYLWLRTEAEALTVLWTFILNLFCAVPIYLSIPVCGPKATFPTFPVLPLHVASHAMVLNSVSNGFPSVHTSTAILILWFAWKWKVGQIFSLVYLGLIVVATLGSGQHYLFDLVGAVPYTALILYLGKLRRARRANLAESPADIPLEDPPGFEDPLGS